MKKTLLFLPIFYISIFMMSSCNKNPTSSKIKALKVTTEDVSAITSTTAQCGGIVTSDGGIDVTACGVCWNTNPTPTISDNKTSDSTGRGSFISNIIWLFPNTTYNVRAYAANTEDTAYGDLRSFTTTDYETGTVTDIDGNTYQTIKIGNQWWMAENLKVIHYRNGDAVPNVEGYEDWLNQGIGAYCNYDNDGGNSNTYGCLYNWYTVKDNRYIAPEGWHVPTDKEWKELEMYLGMSQSDANNTGYRGLDEGGKLKETGTSHWWSPNTGATNKSHFYALPGGYRFWDGIYYVLGSMASFWSSTEGSFNGAWCRSLSNENSEVHRWSISKKMGYSVRCIKD